MSVFQLAAYKWFTSNFTNLNIVIYQSHYLAEIIVV